MQWLVKKQWKLECEGMKLMNWKKCQRDLNAALPILKEVQDTVS